MGFIEEKTSGGGGGGESFLHNICCIKYIHVDVLMAVFSCID